MTAYNGYADIAQVLVLAGANLDAKGEVGPHAGGHCVVMAGVARAWGRMFVLRVQVCACP